MTEELNILKRESIGLLKEMVGIPSPSFGEEAVCTHIYNWLSNKGLHPERIGNNLVCELVTDSKGEVTRERMKIMQKIQISTQILPLNK